MNTEITDIANGNSWVLYDGDCRHCVGLAERFRGPLLRRGFRIAPLQAAWVRRRLGLSEDALLAEMRLLKPDGEILGGADALIDMSRRFWWAWPVRLLGRVPIGMSLLRAGYRWVARHRHCPGGVCKVEVASPHFGVQWVDAAPLLILSLGALAMRGYLATWVFMWVMAFAFYGGCKWMTYRAVKANVARRLESENQAPPHPNPLLPWGRRGRRPCQDTLATLLPRLGYLLAWPGMNAVQFLDPRQQAAKPLRREWIFALIKTAFGVMTLWILVRNLPVADPLLSGWVGMVGVILMLHFGLFHLLSLAWRQAGRNAPPLMQNPVGATSVADFWGARWNTAFNELAFRFTYRPLRRRMNPAAATLVVFGLSGLIHELVISLPARGGYGLPTLYFLAQGVAIIVERSRPGIALGLGGGVRGWLFAVLVVAGPVYWLFHPLFVCNVILPMLTAIGVN